MKTAQNSHLNGVFCIFRLVRARREESEEDRETSNDGVKTDAPKNEVAIFEEQFGC
jgi:hypothetical protein